jgi:hypothetical protein
MNQEKRDDLFESGKSETELVLENEGIKQMIEMRGIEAVDCSLIEELVAFDKELLVNNFHNFFNNSREASASELKSQLAYHIDSKKSPELVRLYEIMLHFAEKYHWMNCYGLERALEKYNRGE